MIERIPADLPDLPDDPGRTAVKGEFLDAFIDLGHWERDGSGDGRSALVLLGQLIAISVDTESIQRLSARIRHFLDNEAVRRDFFASLGEREVAFEDVRHAND